MWKIKSMLAIATILACTATAAKAQGLTVKKKWKPGETSLNETPPTNPHTLAKRTTDFPQPAPEDKYGFTGQVRVNPKDSYKAYFYYFGEKAGVTKGWYTVQDALTTPRESPYCRPGRVVKVPIITCDGKEINRCFIMY